MNLFEFIMVLTSIIVGMGLTELLSGIADSMTRRNKREFSWIHLLLSFALLFGIVKTWWELWDFHTTAEWTFPNLLLMLSPSIILYLVARILNPGREFKSSVEEYYFKNARLIWILVAIAIFIGNTFRTITQDAKLFIVDNLSAVPMLLISVLLIISTNRKLHMIMIIISIIMIFLDVLLINFLIST
jgi:hypothetical protein